MIQIVSFKGRKTMNRMRSTQFGLGMFLVWSLATPPASASGVIDRAAFFSESAVAAANARLDQLRQQTGRELRIETFPEIPPSRQAEWAGRSQAERREFFQKWVREAAAESRSEGLFVLVCRQPSHLEVGMSSALKNAGFTSEQRQEVVKTLLTTFKSKQYDAGLEQAVTLVEAAFADLKRPDPGASEARTGPTPAIVQPPSPATADSALAAPSWDEFGMGSWLLLAAVIVGGLVLVMFILRALSGAMGGTGSGMFGGLLTGLLGAMAGSWLYDQFFGNTATAGETSAEPEPVGATAGHDDWESTGGDFGGDDFGGSDGGDF